MVKVSSSDAFDILVKDDKKHMIKHFGVPRLFTVRDHFIDNVDAVVDVNDESVKEAYQTAVVIGGY